MQFSFICWIGYLVKYWSTKLWEKEKGCFVMGDGDLQVELTLNEKEILIVTCMVTE